ncbi:MAG: cytidylate kinase-like family protein [Acidobacteriota bacterium]|nr:cytidylate kinase-like family protein [Acidobacteriota bacterium]
MIRILTIEREFGTGAPYIAQTIAERMGWKFWDHEITDEIARRLKCKAELVERREEKLDSVFYRLMKAFMRGSFESHTDAGLELLDAEHLAALFEKVILEIAERGNCVIMGRGAPYFLRNRKDAFHVFLYAPYGEKLRRIIEIGKSRREAEDLLESVDAERAAFIRKYYDKEWPDRYLYNMMLNVQTGDDRAIETILNGMNQLS